MFIARCVFFDFLRCCLSNSIICYRCNPDKQVNVRKELMHDGMHVHGASDVVAANLRIAGWHARTGD